jgi:hypothetical protein
VSISPCSFVVRVFEAITKTEEVSMHPTLIMALADKVESDRRGASQKVRLRSLCKRIITKAGT